MTVSPSRVIVEWVAGASTSARRGARAAAGVDFTDDLGDRRFQVVEVRPGRSPRAAVRELEADPAVVHAERDGYYELDSIPDDPLFGQLWAFQNTGLGINGFEGAVASDDIDVLDAWERTVGTPDTVIADIDGGYRFEHPDLADVVWTNPEETPENGLDEDGDGIADDVHGADFVGLDADNPVTDGDPTDDDPYTTGHGVHTAGIIGARGNNGIGVTGVAQNVSLMPLRACSEAGRCPFSAIVGAVNYAGAHGARVANMSFGGEESHEVIADAIAANPQTLYVISAGNEGVSNELEPKFPCVYNPLSEGRGPVDNVICVAATDQADHLAWFSNWGVNTVDLGAPGTEILSAAPYRYIVKEDFEVDDFPLKWVDSGPDGGFARTNEPPLASYGISDSPGATPVAGSTRASTSVPVTLAPGYQSCAIDIVSASPGGFIEIVIDGEGEGFSIAKAGRSSHKLLDELSGGGEVSVRVSYTAGQNPGPNSGAWIEEIDLHCIAMLGEADGYRFAEGTSMAAPQVTGAAALLFSLKPEASVSEVRQGLLGSVDRVSSLKGKTSSGGRLDAGAATDLFDPVGPPSPSLSATDPPSPSKDNQPRLIGTALPGTSVDIYAGATCSGSPVASGTATQLAGTGIAVAVDDESVTEFSARATDLVPLTSDCSTPISYTEDSDLVAPAAPQLSGTSPASPDTSGAPRILGTAEAESTVRVYADPACEGSPVAAGSAAELESPGISVQVPAGATADFSANAMDASDNVSDCSQPISYTRLKATTEPGGGDGGSTNDGGGNDGSTNGGGNDGGGGGPSIPECVVPRLVGKTLARAKAALTGADCKLGTVRKPRPRKGPRLQPLVVKASSPALGAKPPDGKVNLTLGPKPTKRTDSVRSVRIATWNVNSVKQRLPRLLPWLDERHPDVVCLQETKLADDAFQELLRDELTGRGYEIAVHGEATWNGVAILSRVGLEDVSPGLAGAPGFPHPEARALAATCGGIRLLSVYVPNGREPGSEHYEYKLAWLAALRDAVAAGPEATVVCGDVNIAPTDEDVFDPEAYAGQTHVTAPERAALAELQALGLRDVVRDRWPDERVFTYWDYRAGMFHRDLGMRIDLILAGAPVADRVRAAWVDRQARKGKGPSDHAPVIVDLDGAPDGDIGPVVPPPSAPVTKRGAAKLPQSP